MMKSSDQVSKTLLGALFFFCLLFHPPYIHGQSQTQESKFEGYLFAYFEGTGNGEQQEQLRFAVSADAVNWTALNGNMPIMASTDISQTGGIREIGRASCRERGEIRVD